jgi:hypothetical protein
MIGAHWPSNGYGVGSKGGTRVLLCAFTHDRRHAKRTCMHIYKSRDASRGSTETVLQKTLTFKGLGSPYSRRSLLLKWLKWRFHLFTLGGYSFDSCDEPVQVLCNMHDRVLRRADCFIYRFIHQGYSISVYCNIWILRKHRQVRYPRTDIARALQVRKRILMTYTV